MDGLPTYQDLAGATEERFTGAMDFRGGKLGHVFTTTSSSSGESTESGPFSVGAIFLHKGAGLAVECAVSLFKYSGLQNGKPLAIRLGH